MFVLNNQWVNVTYFYVSVQACWAQDPASRPRFRAILSECEQLQRQCAFGFSRVLCVSRCCSRSSLRADATVHGAHGGGRPDAAASLSPPPPSQLGPAVSSVGGALCGCPAAMSVCVRGREVRHPGALRCRGAPQSRPAVMMMSKWPHPRRARACPWRRVLGRRNRRSQRHRACAHAPGRQVAQLMGASLPHPVRCVRVLCGALGGAGEPAVLQVLVLDLPSSWPLMHSSAGAGSAATRRCCVPLLHIPRFLGTVQVRWGPRHRAAMNLAN